MGLIKEKCQVLKASVILFLFYLNRWRSYLAEEGFEEVGLVSERVVNQPVTKRDNAVRKVMLREPRHHTLLLHVRTSCYVYYQIPQVLPVPAKYTNY